MNVGDVMDEVATRLRTIASLAGRTYEWPTGKVTPPAAVVSYPEEIMFDQTYGRGTDRMTLPLVVVVGSVTARTTRDLVAAYADGSGASSIKAVLESGTYTAFDIITVTSAEFDALTLGGTDYIAGLFSLDIIGPGSGS